MTTSETSYREMTWHLGGETTVSITIEGTLSRDQIDILQQYLKVFSEAEKKLIATLLDES